ncbi:glucose/galactose MFS transporter [Sporocytophaga myxococcoides]|uniref:glucose/galactose MFS transporter n=1 Tax=Sporocytophaga myxococcoides TaxID=153721 RepID=UPI0004177392|nr:glucose/galactose MFS transporter [Sporocytophaga myxococcoides]
MENNSNSFKGKNLQILISFGVLFLMWGFITNLNFVYKDYLAYIFNLNYSLSTLINLTFFTTYLVVSLQAGNLISKIGYKKGIMVGWVLSCLGCFTFFLAVYFRNFECFLAALFMQAAGITILQVGANLYIVLWKNILLKANIKTAASRLVLMQAFNSLGAFLAPFLASPILWMMIDIPLETKNMISSADRFLIEAPYVHYPYLFVAIAMTMYAVYLFFVKIPQIDTSGIEPANKMPQIRRRHVMHFPQLRLGAFAIFAYVGAEVSLGNYLTDFSKDTVIYYWGAAMVGRFVGSFLVLQSSLRKSVGICAGMSILLVILSVITGGTISFWMIVAVGLFNSILFPAIFTLGVNGLGKFSEDGSSVLIMSIVGGAIIPFNVINFSYVSYKIAFLIVIVCYFYIALYGLKLSRFDRIEEKEELQPQKI